MKARGWQRIGIILSVIWFVGFGGFLWTKSVDEIIAPYRYELESCHRVLDMDNDRLQYITDPDQRDKKLNDNFAKLHKCEADAKQQWESTRPDDRQVVAGVVAVDIVSIILGWLIVWGCVALVRWVRRGFVAP